MERGGKGKTAIPEEEKADEPSILPMTPESKQLAAVIATAVATARPFQRNWQLTLGGFLSMYHHGTPQDTAKL